MKINKLLQLTLTCGLLFGQSSLSTPIHAAERPTFNHHTRDPRPDILPHPLYYAHTEYRRRYNRPRFFTGWLAYKIAPSSQEAMVWHENFHAGRYDQKHMPPVCKRYFAPKPWEVLNTGARPDFPDKQEGSVVEEYGQSGSTDARSPQIVTNSLSDETSTRLK